jgi:hypothetical protein
MTPQQELFETPCIHLVVFKTPVLIVALVALRPGGGGPTARYALSQHQQLHPASAWVVRQAQPPHVSPPKTHTHTHTHPPTHTQQTHIPPFTNPLPTLLCKSAIPEP